MALIADATDEELQQYKAAIDAEIQRRATLVNAETNMDKVVRDLLKAKGVKEGDPWEAPTGYENAYPLGWRVTHGGDEWTSLFAGNTLEPGVSGWEKTIVDGEAPPEYKTPAGYLDVYNTGDKVTFEGAVYECLVDGVSWSPTEAPTVWKQI